MRCAALLFLVLTTPLFAGGVKADNSVTHGPILGRLGAHHVGVWVRTAQPGEFSVRYGTAADKLTSLAPPVRTRLDHDNTGWLLIDGLKANTKYWYQVVLADAGKKQPDGSFRTLPDAEEMRDAKLNPRGLFNFRFEYACGNNQNAGQGSGPALPAFKTMLDKLQDKINFAVLNGDWLYEAEREHKVADWLKQVKRAEKDLPPVVKTAPNIVGVWENYKLYLSRGKNLSAWHRNMPSFFTFDDHEILNDVWGTGQAGVRERRAVFRDVGVQAWYDYLGWSNPVAFKQQTVFGKTQLKKGNDILVDPEADFTKLDLKEAGTLHVHWGLPTAGVNDNALDDQKPGDPNACVYDIVKVLDKHRLKISPAPVADSDSSYSIGRRNYFKMRVSNCDFFFLDTRGHRDLHDLDNPKKPGISMIGKQQKAWLKEEMKNSDADFLFVISSVNFMIPHRGGGAVRPKNKDDAWTVFVEEREELIKYWDKLNKPVLVLTGDLHNSFVIKITDNVWEFASGPHNSNNHIVGDEGNRPANGEFDSEGHKVQIRWSTSFLNDIPRAELLHHYYCVVQVNNVFNNPLKLGGERWVAFPKPQVVFQYYDGYTGELRYAEAIMAR